VLRGAVYRCGAPGCGREVVELRPTSAPGSGACLSCHGREMERTEQPEG
jgi:cytochrome c553